MRNHFFTFLFCLAFISQSLAQQYSYVNYDSKDGLAGSTVYDLCQDRDGFIWFATKSGLSRFDGTQFKNFTIDDGLPANEILRVFADSHGRIWMSPFKNTICYYHKGKIHTADNDEFLKKLPIRSYVINIAEDIDGNLAIQAGGDMLYLGNAKAGSEFKVIKIGKAFNVTSAAPQKGFLIGSDDSLFSYNGDKFSFWKLGPEIDYNKKLSITFTENSWVLDRKPGTNSVDIIRGKYAFVNTIQGSWSIDTIRGQYGELFLENSIVNHALVDKEGSIWFATTGEGVFRLASNEFKTWNFTGNNRSEIYFIQQWRDGIACGAQFNRIYFLSPAGRDSIDMGDFITLPPAKSGVNRAYTGKTLSTGAIVVGFDGLLAKISGSKRVQAKYSSPVKSIEEIDAKRVLVATSQNIVITDVNTLQPLDTVWIGRSTTISYFDSHFYVGTPDGLYCVNNKKETEFLGKDISPLRGHISQVIHNTDGITWVAIQGQGLVGIKNRKLYSHITKQTGLTSNICISLFKNGSALWVGTEKGLNRIKFGPTSNNISHFTIEDGLPSNTINCIFARDKIIYVGTPAGVTSFNPDNVPKNFGCEIKLLELQVNNKVEPLTGSYVLAYNKSHIKLSFIGLSYKSAPSIIYYYRFSGINNYWDSTTQTVLEFPKLPSGKHTLELFAINKFGSKSNIQSINFEILPPLWQRAWFWIGAIVLLTGLIWFFISKRIKSIHKKEWEKLHTQYKINDLEQRVQRAQMNPHFIFNCLNSIQNFIIQNNLEASNQYLTEFASLVRQTLDQSDKTSISLDREIKYLTSYLQLEKMMSGNSFQFAIKSDHELRNSSIHIPSMFLQPFVENSIRHGIRPKKEKNGFILVKFIKGQNDLVCVIQDNGVGRKYKFYDVPKGHESKGMSLVGERMNTLNKLHPEKIKIEINDLVDSDGKSEGTQAIITFPFAILETLNT